MKHKPEYIPSPEEIKKSCELLRKKWSKYDLEKRCHFNNKYTIPICDLDSSYKESILEKNIYRFY